MFTAKQSMEIRQTVTGEGNLVQLILIIATEITLEKKSQFRGKTTP